MIDKQVVQKIVEVYLEGKEIFLVGIKVSNANSITILADTINGINIEECAAIHRYVEKELNRDREDFELQVSSPGLDLPFAVLKQYYKNEGRKVEVVDTEGSKFAGVLKNVNQGGFELETEVKAKGKAREMKDISFNYENVKSTRVLLTVK